MSRVNGRRIAHGGRAVAVALRLATVLALLLQPMVAPTPANAQSAQPTVLAGAQPRPRPPAPATAQPGGASGSSQAPQPGHHREADEYFYAVRNPAPAGQSPRRPTPLAESLSRPEVQRAAPAAAAAAMWESIGKPAVGGQIPGGGNVSGRVLSVAIDPTNPLTVYLGAAFGGVWKSTDAGQSWTAITDAQNSLAVTSVVLDPTAANKVYAATGDKTQSNGSYGSPSYFGAGILVSSDAGGTWTTIGANRFTGQAIYDLDISNDGQTLYVAATNGFWSGTPANLFTQRDTASWTSVRSNHAVPERIYLARPPDAQGLLGGPWWYTPGSPSPLQSTLCAAGPGCTPAALVGIGRTTLAIDATDGTHVLASVACETPAGANQCPPSTQPTCGTTCHGWWGVWESTDSGLTYRQLVSASQLVIAGATTPEFAQTDYDLALALDPTDARYTYIGLLNLWRYQRRDPSPPDITNITSPGVSSTTSNCFPWDRTRFGLQAGIHCDQHAVSFDRTGALYVGNDGGIFASPAGSRGATWVNLNTGNLAITQFYPGFSVAQKSSLQRILGGTQDNGTLTWDGASWQQTYAGDGGQTAIDPTAPSDSWFAEYINLSLQATSDGSTPWSATTNPTWSPANNGMPVDSQGRVAGALFIAPFSMDPTNPLRLLAGADRPYRTRDGAKTWTDSSGSGGVFPLTAGAISAVATCVDPSRRGLMYLGTTTGSVFRSRNGYADAPAWTNISDNLPANWVTRIVCTADGSGVFVTLGGSSTGASHVFRRREPGWVDLPGLPDTTVTSLAIDPCPNPSVLYAGTDAGVWQSTDAGATWARYGTGLPKAAPVVDVRLDSNGSTLYAATHGRSVWRAPASAPPRVCKLTPAQAPVDGEIVTLTGVGFIGAQAVTFGNTPALWYVVDSDTQIRAYAPTGTGSVQVRVIVNGQMSPDAPENLLVYLSPPASQRTAFYTYSVLAQTGVAGLTQINPNVSINDAGNVAFVARAGGGEHIFVASTPSNLRNINPNTASSKVFGDAVQINNANQVVSHATVPGPTTLIDRWDANATDSSFLIATSGTSFDSVLAFPSINTDNRAVFGVLSGASTSLAAGSQPPPPAYARSGNLAIPLRPVIADDGRVVLRAGNLDTDPIRIYAPTLGDSFSDVACTATGGCDHPNFLRLGRAPGISRNGRIVVFYGDLSPGGALDYGTTPGPGIFASIQKTTGGVSHRVLVRIAAQQPGDLRIKNFDADGRVSVNTTQADQRGVTIVYDAYTSTGSAGKTVFSSRLNFFGLPDGTFDANNPAAFTVSDPPTVVAAVGDTLDGLPGTVQDLNVFDAVNSRDRGDVALWVQASGGVQAVVRARPRQVVYLDFAPTASSKFIKPYATELFSALGATPTWSGTLDDVFTRLAPGRADLQGQPALDAIHAGIVDKVQRMFTELDPSAPGKSVNVYVTGRPADGPPGGGPYVRVLIGDGGGNRRTAVGAALYDLFNQSSRYDPKQGKFVYEQETPLVFLGNIFDTAEDADTCKQAASSQSGQRCAFTNESLTDPRPISLMDTGPSMITIDQVENAVADVVAHEVGHALGIERLDNSPDPRVMDADISSSLINGAPRDRLRQTQSFGAQDRQLLASDCYTPATDTETSAARLAFAVGSDIDESSLRRDPPSDVVQKCKQLGGVRASADPSLTLSVTRATLGVAADETGQLAPVSPELTDLGGGTLANILSRDVRGPKGGKCFVAASTTGTGIDVFSVGTGYLDQVDQIDLTSGLQLLTDPRLRSAVGTPFAVFRNDPTLGRVSLGFANCDVAPPPTLQSIAIIPSTTSLPVGGTQQFTASGTYSDGTKLDLTATASWSSSAPTIASISSGGLATGVAAGTTTVTAALAGINSTANLTVTSSQPRLVSIAVTPSNPSIVVGATQQFTATGTYSDGSTRNLTSTATWSSSNPAVATISSAGLASAVTAGTTTTAAASASISGSTNLTVTSSSPTLVSIAVTPPNSTILIGATQQFTATGAYSDGSTRNLTAGVTWSSQMPDVATITSAGLATGVSAGSTVISAASGSVSGSTRLQVNAPPSLVSIAVTPANPSITVGAAQQFTATGTYSDGSSRDLTNTATWSSSNQSVATISSAGRASGLQAGTSTITAASGSISGSTTLTVVPPTNTVRWIASSSGFWQDAGNWSTGALPGPNDDVVIDVTPPITVTFSQGSATVLSLRSTDAFVLSGGSLSLTTASDVSGAFTLSNGILDGAGDLTLSGQLTWSASGTMQGTGKTIVQGGLLLSGSGLTLNRTLENAAAATWNGAGYVLGSGLFINRAGAVLDIQNDADFYPTLTNAGTVRKSVGSSSGQTFLRGGVNNNGLLDLQVGTVVFDNRTGVSGGSFNGAAGTSFKFAAHTFTSSSSITAPTVVFQGNNIDINGSYNVSSSTTFMFGPIVFNPSATVISLGAVAVGASYSGTVTFNTSAPISMPSLTLTQGSTLDGTADITVTGLLTWNGSATMQGTGKTIAQSGVSLSGAAKWLNRTLENASTTTWSDAGAVLGSGPFINRAGALLDIQNDADFYPTLTNAGTVRKSVGSSSGQTFLRGSVNNNGVLDVQVGNLAIEGGVSTGSFTAAPGSTFTFGSHLFQSSASVAAPAVVFNGNTVTFNGTYNVSETTTFAMGSVVFSSSAAITRLGAVTLGPTYGGTVPFNTSAPVSMPSLTLTKGILDGTADITVSGPLTWNGPATMQGSGKTTALSGVTFSANGEILSRTLESAATSIWTGGYVLGSGVFVNRSGVLFDIRNDSDFYPTLTNFGTIRKSVGSTSGQTFLRGGVNNNGLLDLQVGTVAFDNRTGVSSGSFNGAASTTFKFAAHTFTSSSSITAPTVVFQGNFVYIDGTYNVSGSTTFLYGPVVFDPSATIVSLGAVTLDLSANTVFNTSAPVSMPSLTLTRGVLDGTADISVVGQLNWNGDAQMRGTGKTIAQSSLLMNSTGKTLFRTLENRGAGSWSGGYVYTGYGAIFRNTATGTFDIASDGVWHWCELQFAAPCNIPAPAPSVENAGTMTKSGGTGTLSFKGDTDFPYSKMVAFRNSGTLEVRAGTIAFGPEYTQTGGTLRMRGGGVSGTGALSFLSGSLSGAGQVAANVNMAGQVDVGDAPGVLTITGTYTQSSTGLLMLKLGGLAPGAQFDRLVVSGSATLDGTLKLVLINGYSPSSGDSFQVITFASRSGAFATIDGGGRTYAPTFSPTALTVVAQ